MVVIDGIIFSLQRSGGISTYFNELLSRLLGAGIPVNCFVYGQGTGLAPIEVQRRARMLERYRACRLGSTAQRVLFHSSYYRLPSRNHGPVVTTVHDFTYERFSSGPRRWIHSWQKSRAIEGADAVICVSESTRKDLLEFMPHISLQRVHVIHNGVSDDFRPVDKADDALASRPYVLYVGSRSRYKNFGLAVEAVSSFEGVDFVAVGGGTLTSSEERLLEQKLCGRYELRGVVDVGTLKQLYNGAICLLYPSSYEGFGIPVLEAMRAGCPVVALDASSIPEVAGSAASLVPRADPELFASAISHLRNAAVRDEFRARGQRQAARFSWDKTFSETMNVYQDLLGEPLT